MQPSITATAAMLPAKQPLLGLLRLLDFALLDAARHGSVIAVYSHRCRLLRSQ
jgi:hypothetical protein